jgi:hypothetical protein
VRVRGHCTTKANAASSPFEALIVVIITIMDSL